MTTRRTWAERAAAHPDLRAFIDATIERERIAVQTARDEAAHWKDIAERLHSQLEALRSPVERHRRGDRDRHIAYRRRRQSVPPCNSEAAR